MKNLMDGTIHVLVAVKHHRLLLIRECRLHRLTHRRANELEAHGAARHDLVITREDRAFCDGLEDAALAGFF